MKIRLITSAVLIFVVSGAVADTGRVYRWVDDEGVVHFGDSIPAEYAELPKQVLNDHGVTIDQLQGKKTPEQIEAERKARELDLQKELQRRADLALLATYLSEEEIVMHRDRRVELFQAQAKVTELYLRNLRKRLESLTNEASGFTPYSEDENAPLVDPSLVDEISDTENTIARHEKNLRKYQNDEQTIIDQFNGDIMRFRDLKGITAKTTVAAQPVPE